MLRVNVSHSPLTVTLISDENIIGSYTGTIEEIVGELVGAVYGVGTLDGYKAGLENCPDQEGQVEKASNDKGLFDNKSE